VTNSFHRDSFNSGLYANTDGWGNKLVTIFAPHLDSFIVTLNFSLIYQIRDFGSGQIFQPRQLYLSPGLAKIAPWWLARRDKSCLKHRDTLTDGLTPPTFTPSTAGPLAQIFQYVMIMLSRRI
jgi:hypothetical protein